MLTRQAYDTRLPRISLSHLRSVKWPKLTEEGNADTIDKL